METEFGDFAVTVAGGFVVWCVCIDLEKVKLAINRGGLAPSPPPNLEFSEVHILEGFGEFSSASF